MCVCASQIVHDWAEFDANVEHTEELSRRLAVCNVDWDRVCAKDLLGKFPADGPVCKCKSVV